jgi:hypothetical protein
VRTIRSLEFFASRKEQTAGAPRQRNAVTVEAGWRDAASIDADASLSLATMLAAGSTAEESLDRHTMALAQCALMFLLVFFHAISVAAAEVCVCERERERERGSQLFNLLSFPSSPPFTEVWKQERYVMRSSA